MRLTRFAATVANLVFAPSAAPSFTFGDLLVAESEKLLRTARDFSDRSLRFESCQSQKKKPPYRWLFFLRLTRFERATPTSAGWCSNPAELQSQIKNFCAVELLSRKRQELNLPTPYGSDGLAIRCITALPRFLKNRSERDSNPRTREDQRFSRPPQYDRFGIAPISFNRI